MTVAANLKIEENPFARKLGIKEWQERPFIQPRPEEYLIDGLIPANALVSLQAGNVFGKTTLATQLAMSVAFGLPFLGRYSCLQPGKVLYINARDTDEDSHRRFKRLVREWTTIPGLSSRIDEQMDNLTHISLFDECFGIPNSGDTLFNSPVNLPCHLPPQQNRHIIPALALIPTR